MQQLAYAIENAIAYIQAHPNGSIFLTIALCVVAIFAYYIRKAERELKKPNPVTKDEYSWLKEQRPIQHEILDDIHSN